MTFLHLACYEEGEEVLVDALCIIGVRSCRLLDDSTMIFLDHKMDGQKYVHVAESLEVVKTVLRGIFPDSEEAWKAG